MKPLRGGLTIGKLALITIGLVMLLAGCAPGNGAALGPNPGGGFYSPSNFNNGRVNP